MSEKVLKVLFVDDEALILDAFRRSLRDEFAVNTAVGGEQGLAEIRSNGPFGVVVSDMRMPGMGGAEFLAEVRAKAPDTVRILLTGHADLDAAIDAVNRGNIFRFLTKPCEKSVLIEAVQKGLEQYRAIVAGKELVKKAEMLARTKSEWDSADIYQAKDFKDSADFPGAEEAKRALQALVGGNSQSYVVLVKITLLRTIEERYGEKAADEYLQKMIQFIAQWLRAGDQLFHWSRDVLLALVQRPVTPAALRMEISRLMLHKQEEIADLNGRKVMIANSIAFDLLPIARFGTINDLFLAFDAKLVGQL